MATSILRLWDFWCRCVVLVSLKLGFAGFFEIIEFITVFGADRAHQRICCLSCPGWLTIEFAWADTVNIFRRLDYS